MDIRQDVIVQLDDVRRRKVVRVKNNLASVDVGHEQVRVEPVVLRRHVEIAVGLLPYVESSRGTCRANVSHGICKIAVGATDGPVECSNVRANAVSIHT